MLVVYPVNRLLASQAVSDDLGDAVSVEMRLRPGVYATVMLDHVTQGGAAHFTLFPRKD